MRGTEQLTPEQKPGMRKQHGRTQPYRRKRGRQKGPTLEAMLRGAPNGLPNPADMARLRQARAKLAMKRRRKPFPR